MMMRVIMQVLVLIIMMLIRLEPDSENKGVALSNALHSSVP